MGIFSRISPRFQKYCKIEYSGKYPDCAPSTSLIIFAVMMGQTPRHRHAFAKKQITAMTNFMIISPYTDCISVPQGMSLILPIAFNKTSSRCPSFFFGDVFLLQNLFIFAGYLFLFVRSFHFSAIKYAFFQSVFLRSSPIKQLFFFAKKNRAVDRTFYIPHTALFHSIIFLQSISC